MASSGADKVVCVTGSSGYIASWLVKFFLNRCYTVKATVRDPRCKDLCQLDFQMGNVKDVANAHIQAFEIPSANGRYCLVENVVHHSEIVNILRELYPNIQLPERCADDNPYVPTYQVSKEKIKSLGIDYIPFKVSVKETVESLKEKGFVQL